MLGCRRTGSMIASSSLTSQSREVPDLHQERHGYIESLGSGEEGSKRHTASRVSRLGLWSQTGILPENLGDSGGNWSWEKSWGMTQVDTDRLWTCQRVGQCRKPGGGLEQQLHTDFFQMGNCGAQCRDFAQDNKEGGGGCDLLPLSSPHRLMKEAQSEMAYLCLMGTNVQSGK